MASRASQTESCDDLQTYNGLDACITLEILENLKRLYPAGYSGPIYAFERALQGPVLAMMQNGWRIDKTERSTRERELRAQIAELEVKLQRLALAVWDRPLNPRSPLQCQEFFYDCMKLPRISVSKKGVRKEPMDIDVLETLKLHLYARPIINIILGIRDLNKQLDIVKKPLSSDGRFKYNFKITGTVTGRFSSTKSNDNLGDNIQNKAEEMRRMFIADEGKKLFGVDLEQSDSRWVGWLCGVLIDDWSYHDACCSGDLHTQVCKMIWPDLGWSGDPKLDRRIADRDYMRGNSYRQVAKKAGHATNFLGKAYEIALQLGISTQLVIDFQRRYLAAFPCILEWQKWVLASLRQTHSITTPFARLRHFFDRLPYADSITTGKTDKILRDAIAQTPQSSTSEHEKLGLWRIWHHMPEVALVAEVHDAVYGNYDSQNEQSICARILKHMEIELTHEGHILNIPSEIKIGWNWATYASLEDVARAKSQGQTLRYNPDGLKKWKAGEPDLRIRSEGLAYVL